MGSAIESTACELKCRLNTVPYWYSFYMDLPEGWDMKITLTNTEGEKESFELFEAYEGEKSLLAQLYRHIELKNEKEAD